MHPLKSLRRYRIIWHCSLLLVRARWPNAWPEIALDADVFTTWAATGPALKSVLRIDGGTIVCQELRTRFPPVAAWVIAVLREK